MWSCAPPSSVSMSRPPPHWTVINDLLLVCVRSSQQSLHRKEVDHATCQLFLNLKLKKSAWEVARSCWRKLGCCEKKACLSSLCPACSPSPWDMTCSLEKCICLCPTPPFPLFFFLIAPLQLSVNNPLSPPLISFTHLFRLFKEWIRSYFFLFLSNCVPVFVTGGFSGRVTALNQTSALWSSEYKGGLPVLGLTTDCATYMSRTLDLEKGSTKFRVGYANRKSSHAFLKVALFLLIFFR